MLQELCIFTHLHDFYSYFHSIAPMWQVNVIISCLPLMVSIVGFWEMKLGNCTWAWYQANTDIYICASLTVLKFCRQNYNNSIVNCIKQGFNALKQWGMVLGFPFLSFFTTDLGYYVFGWSMPSSIHAVCLRFSILWISWASDRMNVCMICIELSLQPEDELIRF